MNFSTNHFSFLSLQTQLIVSKTLQTMFFLPDYTRSSSDANDQSVAFSGNTSPFPGVINSHDASLPSSPQPSSSSPHSSSSSSSPSPSSSSSPVSSPNSSHPSSSHSSLVFESSGSSS